MGIIYDIRRFSIHDGPGIRTTVFFKGCPLECHWCHNPESRSSAVERTKKLIKLDGKTIYDYQECGYEIDTDKLMSELLKDNIFYESSTGGVTFSGGEPLHQPEFLRKSIAACKEHDIHVCIDTSGYLKETIFKEIACITNMFLYDIKFISRDKHIAFTGVDNDNILKNLIYLDKADIPYIIRIPLIPGYTYDRDNLSDIVRFLQDLENVKKVSLLPYHKTGTSKYNRFKIKNRCKDLGPMTENGLKEAVDLFSSHKWKTDMLS